MQVSALASTPPASLAPLIAKYEASTPRYTSYPTALQFTPQVNASVYQRWLGELADDRPVSLYVHVPFCSRLCWYCGCNTRVVNRTEPIREYARLLITEIERVGDALGGRPVAQALHFGGGTPNTLPEADFAAVAAALRRVFRAAPELELAVELDPAGLSRSWLAAAARQGLSRASLGVQTLAPKVQAAVNRRETFEEVAACVGWLRDVDVRSINLDLMYGLPHQTSRDIVETLDQVLRLDPERLAVFGYAHVPWMKSHQQLIDSAALPGATERIEQSEAAAERLLAEGYVRIGIDHYARSDDSLACAHAEGRLRRNFQGYTADPAETLIGFGASAIGRTPQGYVQNHAQELAWRNALAAGELPVARGRELDDEDRFRGELIERLMCDMALDFEAVARRHGRRASDLAEERVRLMPYVADGLAHFEDDRFVVEPDGRLLLRSMCTVFDAYAAPAGRHSSTV